MSTTAAIGADFVVPDSGLDADGSMTLDYGSRRFTVGFDEQLRPHVRDAAGRPGPLGRCHARDRRRAGPADPRHPADRDTQLPVTAAEPVALSDVIRHLLEVSPMSQVIP